MHRSSNRAFFLKCFNYFKEIIKELRERKIKIDINKIPEIFNKENLISLKFLIQKYVLKTAKLFESSLSDDLKCIYIKYFKELKDDIKWTDFFFSKSSYYRKLNYLILAIAWFLIF